MVRFHVGAQKNSPVARWRQRSGALSKFHGPWILKAHLVCTFEYGQVLCDVYGTLPPSEAPNDGIPRYIEVVLQGLAII